MGGLILSVNLNKYARKVGGQLIVSSHMFFSENISIANNFEYR